MTNPGELGPSTLRRLRTHARSAGAHGRRRGPAVSGHSSTSGSPGSRRVAARRLRDAWCAGSSYAPTAERACGRTGASATAAPRCWSDATTLWLLTSPASISNRHVLERDNAALALRLLGQQRAPGLVRRRLRRPRRREGVSLSRLLPPWLGPGADPARRRESLAWCCGAAGGSVRWSPSRCRSSYGRRSRPGPRPDLPPHRRPPHAAAVLVGAARRRLDRGAAACRRGTTSTPSPHAAAARTGRDPRAVLALLSTTTVPTDAQLAELGSRLIELENEVRTP